jgi:hypothetical protein
LRIDAGLGDAPWQLLAPGCFLGFPAGFTLSTALDDTDPFPELQLHTGAELVADAVVTFEARPVAAKDLQLRGNFDVEELMTASDAGDVRTWEYGYEHEGAPWRKRHYALPVAADHTIMASAQAPASHFDAMVAGADALVASFAPFES